MTISKLPILYGFSVFRDCRKATEAKTWAFAGIFFLNFIFPALLTLLIFSGSMPSSIPGRIFGKLVSFSLFPGLFILARHYSRTGEVDFRTNVLAIWDRALFMRLLPVLFVSFCYTGAVMGSESLLKHLGVSSFFQFATKFLIAVAFDLSFFHVSILITLDGLSGIGPFS
jgi:hypothetical protein